MARLHIEARGGKKMSSCKLCGTTQNLVQHHLSYEPEVLQTLCQRCHRETHTLFDAPKPPLGFYPRMIAVESQTWKGLNALKEPGDSFDNIVTKLLEYWWKNQEEGEL